MLLNAGLGRNVFVMRETPMPFGLQENSAELKVLKVLKVFHLLPFTSVVVVYLEYINNYIVTHTVICNQIFTQH